ncbi:MAG TPA: Flp family type IVb pilin [Chloroflexota bacterium]|nr:Flp family type IVb pilin [Chloroflexota bacterium]
MLKRFVEAAKNAIFGVATEREEGQGMAEYALILVGVAIVVIAALALMGPAIANLLNRVSASLS